MLRLTNSPCTPKALSLGVERQILGVKLAHLLSICGMHTGSDPTRRSRYTTRWFRTSAYILRYAHRARSDLRGANLTLSVCLGHNMCSKTSASCFAPSNMTLSRPVWIDPYSVFQMFRQSTCSSRNQITRGYERDRKHLRSNETKSYSETGI